jgi:hypothetical protein
MTGSWFEVVHRSHNAILRLLFGGEWRRTERANLEKSP